MMPQLGFSAQVNQTANVGSTWDDNDEHGEDFQNASHQSRTFGMGNVLCCQNPLYNHLICTPVPGTHNGDTYSKQLVYITISFVL